MIRFKRLTVILGFTIVFGLSGWGANIDISLSKSAPASVNPATSLVYTLTAKNNTGNKDATNISIVDTLPSGVTYVSASGTNWTCSAVGQSVTCTLSGTLLHSSTAPVLTINTKAPGVLGSITNSATVSQSNSDNDPTPANNTATATTTVQYIYTADNFRDFALVNSYNINGNMQIIGNSVMLESGGTCPNATTNNNNLNPVWADKDADAATWNSTSANLVLPAGVSSSKIKYAGLYWQGRVGSGESFSSGNTILFKPEGFASYQSVAAQANKFNWAIRSQDSSYQGIADVTTLIKQSIDTIPAATIASSGYSGTFWAANILAKEMSNGFGAWSLVIVYEDTADTLKNLSVYDGYKEVTGNTAVPVTLSGFLTPNTAPVNSKFLVFGGEGDISLNDSTTLTNSAGTDIALGSNVFNSSETNSSGANITTRNPKCQNTIGIDIHTYDIGTNGSPSIIGTGQTTTTVKLKGASSKSDTYYPGVFAFSTDIYQPQLCYVENIFKGTTNISGVGVQVNQDENLTVRVYIKNKGSEAATGVQILHQFDSSFPYNANSANYNNSNPPFELTMPPSYARTAASDNSGNDLYEYNSTSLLSKINLGSGATNSSGGAFNPNTTFAVFEYNATVKALDNNYSNVYQAGYVNSVLGLDYTNNPVTIYSCDGSVNSFWGYAAPSTSGTIDAVDTYSNVSYTDANGPDIQTKISSAPNLTLQAVWLGKTNTPQSYTDTTYDTAVIMRLSDATCSTDENLTDSVAGVEAVFAHGSGMTAVTSNSFTLVPVARNNAKIKLFYINWGKKIQDSGFKCSNSNTDATLLGVPQCLASATQITAVFGAAVSTACSVDGARPACNTNSYNNNNVPSAPYDNNYGCYQCLAALGGENTCSVDSFAIRPNAFQSSITANQQFVAKVPALLTFNANDYNAIPALDYNETEHSSFVADLNISDSTKSCAQSSISFSPSIHFINGTVTDNYTLGNVGDFNLSIHENNNGTEFAAVDRDDTDDLARLISPFTRQIKIIPAHFAVDGNLTNGSNGFSYLSNFEKYPTAASRAVSAGLELNITAQAADNNVTTNYTSGCYAKDANITVGVNAFSVSPAGALSKMIWYEKNHDVNGTLPLPGTSYVLPILHTAYDAANGTALVKYLLNFDRNETKAVEPHLMLVNSVNVADSDAVAGAHTPAINSAYYVYGRVNPFSTTAYGTAQAISAQSYMELYGTSPVIVGTTPLSASKTGNFWWVNTLHAPSDGTANVTITDPSGHIPAGAYASGTTAYTNFANIPTTLPFEFQAHIQTVPWLWYGMNALPYSDPSIANLNCSTHPCFNVKVRPAITNWAGSGTNKGLKSQQSVSSETLGEDMLVPRIR